MSPIIIIPNSQEEITLKTDDFKKYVTDAYYSGFNEGYEKGKNEIKQPFVTYRDFEKIDTTPYCGAESTIALYDQTGAIKNDIQRSK